MVNVVKSSSFLDSTRDRYTVYFSHVEYLFLIECLSDFLLILGGDGSFIVKLKSDDYHLKRLKIFLSILTQMV